MADDFDPTVGPNSHPKSLNEDQSTAQRMPSPVRRGSAQQSSGKGTLSVINTDFGGDCDDQKAISQHIAALGPNDQSFFVVSGPHPQRASEAIAQAYYAKTGKYPVVALGQQFEAQKVPEEKIFSLINSERMHMQRVDGFEPVTLEVLQTNNRSPRCSQSVQRRGHIQRAFVGFPRKSVQLVNQQRHGKRKRCEPVEWLGAKHGQRSRGFCVCHAEDHFQRRVQDVSAWQRRHQCQKQAIEPRCSRFAS
ncbi:hypothetical protein HFN63_35615 [Rhizobium leguminosarum]|uniref:hypothetical protein n=1 Tax=Rhizobium leguminosarum TaxID=384 RepID=UPI001C9617EE|nr:hypothetical protein [Rhizobium leguminosarum]MBY5775280.1 hypothetical protein [Rhizobium leguminosarum]